LEVKRGSAEEEGILENINGGLKVMDLVENISRDLKISREEAIMKVYTMYIESKIDTLPLAHNFIDYLKTSAAKKYTFIIIATIAFFIAININILQALRVIGGILLLFVLPGYSLIETMRLNIKSGLEKIVLSITLSITLLLFIGLLMNYSPWGLRPLPLTAMLSIITIALSGIALFRSYNRATKNIG